ncbi:MAG: glycosyltransferase family 39 protein [bacterium]
MTDNSFTRQSSIPKALVALVLSSLVVKLCLIGWNRGEYTDGIIQLQLWETPVVFFPPLYTLLVQLFALFVGDLVVAGRLVSILSSSLVPIPLFFIGRRLGHERAGLLASLFWVLSPMQNRWGLRVMTDSLFAFVFTIALLYFVRAVLDRRESEARALRGMFFWAGIATLTRYHGLVFLMLALPLLRWKIQFRPRRSENESDNVNAGFSWPLPVVLAPWLGLVFWIVFWGFGHVGQFTERASYGLFITMLTYYNHLEGYILYLPWAVGYPLAVWVIYATVRLWTSLGPWGLIRALTVSTLLIWLVVQTAFQSFQFRYFLPLLPLWCLMAGYGLYRWKEEHAISASIWRLTHIIIIGWLTGFSVLVIGLQRNAFADITDAALFISQRPAEERVFSNETYREGVEAVKMSFWSGRPVLGYSQYNLIEPGNLVAIHNIYGNIAADLQRRFTYEVVFRSHKTLYPLLPDIMVFPPGVTSHPAAMSFRFTRQEYLIEVIRITGRRDSTDPSP